MRASLAALSCLTSRNAAGDYGSRTPSEASADFRDGDRLRDDVAEPYRSGDPSGVVVRGGSGGSELQPPAPEPTLRGGVERPGMGEFANVPGGIHRTAPTEAQRRARLEQQSAQLQVARGDGSAAAKKTAALLVRREIPRTLCAIRSIVDTRVRPQQARMRQLSAPAPARLLRAKAKSASIVAEQARRVGGFRPKPQGRGSRLCCPSSGGAAAGLGALCQGRAHPGRGAAGRAGL